MAITMYVITNFNHFGFVMPFRKTLFFDIILRTDPLEIPVDLETSLINVEKSLFSLQCIFKDYVKLHLFG